jgi:hypothetical protein
VAKQFPDINEAHRDFMERQKIFFVASAAAGTHVNLTPRSTDSFRVIDHVRVAYLDRTGSGNETASHLNNGGRITIMLCAFESKPLIMRLFGHGIVHHRTSDSFRDILAEHFGGTAPLGTRQIVTLDVEMLQTSCGFGVPMFDYEGERPTLDRWADAKGADGLLAYQREKNQISLDGLPSGLFDHEEASLGL